MIPLKPVLRLLAGALFALWVAVGLGAGTSGANAMPQHPAAASAHRTIVMSGPIVAARAHHAAFASNDPGTVHATAPCPHSDDADQAPPNRHRAPNCGGDPAGCCPRLIPVLQSHAWAPARSVLAVPLRAAVEPLPVGLSSAPSIPPPRRV